MSNSDFEDPQPVVPVQTASRVAARTDSDDETGHGVHQLGYRSWSGVVAPGWASWMVISEVGIRRAWQSQWLKRMLFLAWLPALWFGIGFFLWEQAAQYPDWQQALTPMMRQLPKTPPFEEVKTSVQTGNLADSRHTVWAWLLQSFFRYPQAVLMVLLVGLIAPPLISQDIRSRAFLLYFSRPITRGEYDYRGPGTRSLSDRGRLVSESGCYRGDVGFTPANCRGDDCSLTANIGAGFGVVIVDSRKPIRRLFLVRDLDSGLVHISCRRVGRNI